MRTVAELTEAVVKESPYLEEALSLGIINLSGLARKIKPQIQARNLKKTSSAAIVMALQRLGVKLKKKTFGRSKMVLPKDIVLRSNLVQFVFESSPRFSRVLSEVVQLSLKYPEILVNATQGVSESTIISGKELAKEVEKAGKNLKLLYRLDDLSAVTLRFDGDTITFPGVYYPVLKALAWQGVSIAEVISAGSAMTMLFEKNKIDRAFSIINGLMRHE